MSDTLEHAQSRTNEFLVLLSAEMNAIGFSETDQPFVTTARKIAPLLDSVEDHIQLREQLAGCFSSVAYDYIMRKFHAAAVASAPQA